MEISQSVVEQRRTAERLVEKSDEQAEVVQTVLVVQEAE